MILVLFWSLFVGSHGDEGILFLKISTLIYLLIFKLLTPFFFSFEFYSDFCSIGLCQNAILFEFLCHGPFDYFRRNVLDLEFCLIS